MNRPVILATTLLLVGLAYAGCGDGGDTPAPPSSSSVPVTTPPTSPVPPDPSPPSTSPATESPSTPGTSGSLPAGMVGTWESSEGNATIVYRFSSDGGYANVSILTQPRKGGLFEFRIQVRGTAEVDGDQLTLRPVAGTHTLKDPDDPSRSYTRAARKEIENYTWSLSGSVLTMTGSDGNTITYDRQ
ncbi:hypothetical protein ACGFNU_00260 [Spirillospora sp. NPDC048911]|uniref:hypothetical protein n=1 Tax=Spirillospora sp. NPDC048911 TaxID=3364527 RepID=UPI00371C88E2